MTYEESAALAGCTLGRQGVGLLFVCLEYV